MNSISYSYKQNVKHPFGCIKGLYLGNVLSVISDVVIPNSTNGVTVDNFTVGIRNVTDFSPFGVELKGRNFEVSGGGNYRYSFQGQESDSEVKGEGNSVNYKYRMHDPRLGRFFAIDPLTNKYPELTPYQFASNSPIFMVEFEGLEGTMYMYRVWEDAEGKHSVSVGSDVVPLARRYVEENLSAENVGFEPTEPTSLPS